MSRSTMLDSHPLPHIPSRFASQNIIFIRYPIRFFPFFSLAVFVGLDEKFNARSRVKREKKRRKEKEKVLAEFDEGTDLSMIMMEEYRFVHFDRIHSVAIGFVLFPSWAIKFILNANNLSLSSKKKTVYKSPKTRAFKNFKTRENFAQKRRRKTNEGKTEKFQNRDFVALILCCIAGCVSISSFSFHFHRQNETFVCLIGSVR